MKFRFENLDEQTRKLMLTEVEADIQIGRLYVSKRFNANGRKHYPQLLLEAIRNGDEETLAAALVANDCFEKQELKRSGDDVVISTVPKTAQQTFVDSEFNRFYMRAIALKAISLNQNLEVYRARESKKPRIESEKMLGQEIIAEKLLSDLRNNIGKQNISGFPIGPNSGLSVKILEKSGV